MNILLKKIKNSDFTFFENIEFIINKSFFQIIKGTLYRFFLGECKGLFFVGSYTKIYHSKKLFVGNNCYISDCCYINCLSKNGVHLGNNVTIREFAWLQLTSHLSNPGDEIRIGNDTYIGPRANLGAAGKLIIGNNCQIGAGVSFIAESHNYSNSHKLISDQGVSRKGIFIGDDCWIGNNAIILDGVTIDNGVVVGAGSVVTKNISSNCVVVGNPARVIKERVNSSNEDKA
jgi:acetyltransferase-like isoleucine patch superfamily enzyme